MHPRTFLRITLLLPLLVPVAAFFSASTSELAAILVMSLFFGGVPYFFTAIVLWRRLGKCKSQRSFIGVVIRAPLLFAPMQVITWFVWCLFSFEHNVDYLSIIGGSLVMSAYGLALGYVYVLFVLVVFAIAIRCHFVTSPEAMTESKPKPQIDYKKSHRGDET